MSFLLRRVVLPGFMYSTLPTFYFVHGMLFVLDGNKYTLVVGAVLIPVSFILKLIRMNGGI